MSIEIEQELSSLFGADVQADVSVQKSLGGAKISIVEMEYCQTNGEHSTNINQSAVFLEQDDLNLPEFGMLRAPKGGLSKFAMSLMGDFNIRFPESPEFDEAYRVTGWVEQTVRELFIAEIRDHFASDSRWQVKGRGKKLVIFQPRKTIASTEQDAFIRDSLQILALFQQGEEHLDTRPELRRETLPEDMTQRMSSAGGMMGAVLKKGLEKRMLKRSDLESFAASPVPRAVPNSLKMQTVGQVGIAITVALGIAVVGFLFAIGLVFVLKGNLRFVGLAGLFMPLMLLGGAVFGMRWRKSKMDLLQNGTVKEGTISQIEDTGVHVNNQKRYRVDIDFPDGTKSSTHVYGPTHQLAEARKDANDSVRFLWNPERPDKSICLDLLLVSEG